MAPDEEENAVRQICDLIGCRRVVEIALSLERRCGKMPGDFSPTHSESTGALDQIAGVASGPLHPTDTGSVT